MISQGDIVLVLQGIFEGAMKEINKNIILIRTLVRVIGNMDLFERTGWRSKKKIQLLLCSYI